MKRLTTDNQDHILASLNLFYAKGNEVWVRGGGPEPDYDDTTLVELIHRAARAHGLNITADEPESLGDEMYDAMFDGVDTVEWIVALLHTAAIQATEMRHRLMSIEDILGDEYDLDRLRELAQADREGRVVVQRFSPGQTVWVIERDEDGEAYDFSGYVFVTSLRGIALVSPKINGSSEIDVILMDQVESRINYADGCIEAYPVDDCYLSREAAEQALGGGGDG